MSKCRSHFVVIQTHTQPTDCSIRLLGLLLPTSSTPAYPAVAGLDSLATLIYAVVSSRMDYCNTVLAGAPRTVTDKLQRVLNAAARVITGTRSLIAAMVRYCTTNCIGSTFPTGFSSS